MANNNTTRTHDPDVKRDFETGTVNPGPGMAPPHRANDIPAGSMSGAQQTQDDNQTTQGKPAESKKSNDSGCCGCG
jgi:hypothetical protein